MDDALPSTTPKSGGKWTNRLAYSAAILLVISLAIGQSGQSAFIAMSGIALAILIGLIAFIIVLIGMIRSKNLSGLNAASLIAIGFGAIAIYQIVGIVSMVRAGGPAIHDITTNTEDPPEFEAIVSLRSPGDNTTSYIDDGTAELQLEAYPDIQTILLEDDATTAFARAMTAAETMGWEIVASDPTRGHIEATASTPFVGFKDDVVIRVRNASNGTRVDVRSKSRIGKGDMGVNAARIRAYRGLLTD
jgi:uncharacterized protein with PQ loop repeat